MKRMTKLCATVLALIVVGCLPGWADWFTNSPRKWVQYPDESMWGIDIKVDQNLGTRILADDFLCTNMSLLTGFHICGSVNGEPYDQPIDPATFITNIYVGIWSDSPDPDGGGPLYSHPSNVLWSTEVGTNFTTRVYAQVVPTGECWWDPVVGLQSWIQPADYKIWQVNIHVDSRDAFLQTGTPSQSNVYWLVVKVWTDGTHEFGWKTATVTEEHNLDDAVYWNGAQWAELRYPPAPGVPGPLVNKSLDLAFVIASGQDFGDAPDNLSVAGYPTLLAHNGARHLIIPGIHLGALIDDETDGQPTDGADGDDTTDLADEDGIVGTSDFIIGSDAWIDVVASTNIGFLQGWIDFNGNRSWADPGEQVFANVLLSTGTNRLTFSIPSTASNGYTYARLRYSTLKGLSDRGPAPDGEVEDYRINLVNPPPTKEAKWERPLDTVYGMDVPSWGIQGLERWVADDFISDGRPITGVRWWGSYINYATNIPGPVPAPGAPHPLTFTLRWLRDIPAGVETNYSIPGTLIDSVTNGVEYEMPIQEHYYTTIWHQVEGFYEHEYVYDLTFTNRSWNEKEGVIYWLSIQANYAEAPTNFAWGWATTPLEYHWNDDAVRANGALPPGFDELHYIDVRQKHPHGSNSLDMAFVLYTDVVGRRAKKWLQPPDMVMGENMDCWFYPQAPGLAKRRGDDFVSDGRRITDIHWWGSYLGYRTNDPGPVSPPPVARVAAFDLSWWTDKPASGQPFSQPRTMITNVMVPIDLCHEVYYGAVTQYWKIPPQFEHEFQYYVDLLNPEVWTNGPWCEQKGTTYWLVIQAVFTNWNDYFHSGWGWKTTPIVNKWNDDSVFDNGSGNWAPAPYPPGPPAHPYAGTNCDLAFELTTDEVGTNHWYQPIVIRRIYQPASNLYVMGSVGDAGSGVQILQQCTNLVTVSNNWADLTTNTLPLPHPYTNYWYRAGSTDTQEYFRIRQK